MTIVSWLAYCQGPTFGTTRIVLIWKKIIASIIVIAIVLAGVYLLFSIGGANTRGGEGGLASPEPRTIVTLAVWGGSAFITGFGLRDVIGRVVATRQRNRLKSMHQIKQ